MTNFKMYIYSLLATYLLAGMAIGVSLPIPKVYSITISILALGAAWNAYNHRKW